MTTRTQILLALFISACILPACGDDDTSDSLAEASNGTTGTSNSTTGSSNGTTGTSNGTTDGTTGTSNGTTGTTGGTTGTDDLARCQTLCTTLAACPELVEACGESAATIEMVCREQFCPNAGLRDALLELEELECPDAVPLVLDRLPDELTDLCTTDPCDGVDCLEGENCVEGVCVDACDGVDCLEGETCIAGACIDLCAEVSCEEGETCVEGSCVPCQADDLEPNNDAEGAAALNAEDQTLADRTVCPGDEDWFSITLAAGQSARVSIAFEHSDGDLTLALLSGDEEITRSESIDDHEQVAIPTVAAEETFLIVVSSADADANNSYTLTVERDPEDVVLCNTFEECEGGFECDLDARVCALDCVSSAECESGEECLNGACVVLGCQEEDGNDTREDAEALDPGAYDGLALCVADSEDWYEVTVEEGSTLYASLNFDTVQGDLDMELYGDRAEPIVASATAEAPEVLIREGLAAGAYDLRVFARVPGTEAEYSLEVLVNPDVDLCNVERQDCPGDQICLRDQRCYPEGACLSDADCSGDAPLCDDDARTCVACIDDLFESNDSFDDAAPIDDNLEPDDTLNTCGGDDYYSFDVEADATLTIDVIFDNSQGDLDIALFGPDSEEEPVARSEDIVDNEHITYAVGDSAGTYVLQVYGFEGTLNTYQLNVSID